MEVFILLWCVNAAVLTYFSGTSASLEVFLCMVLNSGAIYSEETSLVYLQALATYKQLKQIAQLFLPFQVGVIFMEIG